MVTPLFSTAEFFETQKGYTTIFSESEDHKNDSRRKFVKTFLIQKFFDSRNFKKIKTVDYKDNSEVSNNFPRGNRDTLSLSRYQNFSEAQNSAPTKFFGIIRQKKFEQKS